MGRKGERKIWHIYSMDFMDGVEGSKKGYGLMDEVVWMSTISGHGIWMEMFDKKGI